MVALFANSGDPDQMPLSAESDLGLQCLQDTLLGVSSCNGLRKINILSVAISVKLFLPPF